MRVALSSLVAAALAALALSGPVRAEDAVGDPAGPAKPRAKLSHKYVDSLVGSWDLVAKPVGAPEMKGAARWWKALDGTALVEELVAGQGDDAFFGFGVLYVGSDGKSIERWWFDSEGKGGVWHTTGTLHDDGWTLSSLDAGVKTDHVMKKAGDGHAYSMQSGEHAQLEVTYKKAAKECPRPPVVDRLAIKSPFVRSLLGEFAVKGESTSGGATSRYGGVTSIRLGVGGAYAIWDDEASAGGAPTFTFGVLSADAAGTSLREWGFSNFFDAPVVISGGTSKTEWKARGASHPGAAFDSVTTVSDAGFDVKIKFASGDTASETYTRKK